MTTLFIREGTLYREAAPAEVLDRATALIQQRYRTGPLYWPRRTAPASAGSWSSATSSTTCSRCSLSITATVILVHNHPSGVAEPSQADELIAQRLRDALALVDIRVLDQLIVAESITSFVERGLV